MVNAITVIADRVDCTEFREGAQQLATSDGCVGVASTGQQAAERVCHLCRKEVDDSRVASLTGGQVLPRNRVDQIESAGCHIVAFVTDIGRFDQPIASQLMLQAKLPTLSLCVLNFTR